MTWPDDAEVEAVRVYLTQWYGEDAASVALTRAWEHIATVRDLKNYCSKVAERWRISEWRKRTPVGFEDVREGLQKLYIPPEQLHRAIARQALQRIDSELVTLAVEGRDRPATPTERTRARRARLRAKGKVK